ncbi:DNA-binding response regulator [Pseudonocardiaceae bacterium YIM PH 21723]|nr:DNA-binding response regulator [Pseudonocardiaceae bacterium YIM PH 21723]
MTGVVIDALVEAGAVLGSTASVQTRVEEILAVLCPVVRWQAAGVVVLPSGRRAAVPVVADRMPERTLQMVCQAADLFPESLEVSLAQRRALTASEAMAPNNAELFSQAWLQQGFSDGLGTPVLTADGRLIGLAGCCFEDRGQVTENAITIISAMQRMLGPLLDPLGTTAGAIMEADYAAAVLPDATVRCIPGISAGPWLSTGGELPRRVAELMATGRLPKQWWWRDPYGAFHRLITCKELNSVVIAGSEQPLPSGLSNREGEIIELVIQGRTNHQVARALFISPATVGKHMSHIFAKLAVNSRTSLVSRAVDLGFMTRSGD